MERPELMRAALPIAWLLPALLVYLPTGEAVAYLWGADVPNPITEALAEDGYAVLIYAVLVYSCMLDSRVHTVPRLG